MTALSTKIMTFFLGEYVGDDQFGNRYYRARGIGRDQFTKAYREKRWVMYNGMAEPSKVPPEWHGWLHKNTDEVPTPESKTKRYFWQKNHLPNLTGTAHAYYPPGHALKGGKRSKTGGDYTPWRPN